MISYFLTGVLLFIALNIAFYIGAYARCDDDPKEFWKAICWSWRHEPWNVGLCTFVLWIIAAIFALVFHIQFIRDILMS